MEPMKPLPGMKPMEPLKPMEPMRPLPWVHPGSAGEHPWWPIDLGTAAAAGAQGDVRYAYFRDARRLAVDQSGRVVVYDTADHTISGVSQQQGGGRSKLVFTSQRGTVSLDELRVVDGPSPTR